MRGVVDNDQEPGSDTGARLAALDSYAILDTPAEKGFDDVVFLASRICETPVALVSLVALDRQWFKARLGFESCETPLDQSVCAHALRQNETLVIPDLMLDPRTRDNALVTGAPFIRFYAGALLQAAGEPPVGTLCAIDTVPRPEGLTDVQLAGLEALARQVTRQMELRRLLVQHAEASRARERLEAADRDRLDRAARRRQGLLELGDRLGGSADAAAMGYAAAEIAGRTLAGSVAGYATLSADGTQASVIRDWTAPGAASLSGVHRMRDLGSYVDDLRRGDTVAIDDVSADPRTAAGVAALHGLGVRSFVNLPLAEQGRLVAAFFVVRADVHRWTADELSFVREAAERTRAAIERRRAEDALRDLAASLERQVVDRTADRNRLWRLSTDVMLVAQFDGTMVAVNPAWTTLLGWSEAELVGRSLFGLVHPDDRIATREGAKTLEEGHTLLRFENRYRHRDGDYRWISWTVVPGEALIHAVGRDVTAEKAQARALAEAETRLRQSQKMEAVGQLTGGLAHDFNNLLTGIAGSLELLQTRVAQGRLGELDRFVTMAQGAAARAAALTQRLLAFSRQQALDPRPTDLNRLVAGMEDLVRRTVGPQITIETVAGTGLWTVFCDQGQLENALLNLCINARDAMPGGGKVTIETANLVLDGGEAEARDLPAGSYVALRVSDSGTGMPPDVIARAFDPFFTTKPAGQGTGLGLSMIYGFARQSGGQARIRSEVGQGTTVSITLPRHAGAAEMPVTAVRPAAAPRGERGEAVLIVDDEQSVRLLVGEVLRDLGYAALEAVDGAAALRVLRSDARIDLLVTDVGLPGGLNGRQVAEAGRLARPGLKVLFITGFAENAVLNHAHLDPDTQMMSKPFALEALASRVAALIGR